MAASVLLADDSMVVRKIARQYLETAGFQVYEADDGAEAVEIAPELKPDWLYWIL